MVSGSAARADADALDAYSQVVVRVAERLRPSVASLRVTWSRRGRMTVAAGSAVVLTPDGLLVTSAHVVARGDGGGAVLHDGTDLPFTIVGRDPLSDLAVLQVHGGEFAAAELGDAEALRVGQLVVAVGNPLGMAGSVSAGVVSGLGRRLPTRDERTARLVGGVVQTDAALHPGNSGGALADSDGRVVGISTALVGPWLGQGVGLAVPLNAVTRRVIGALITHGRVRRAYLGVSGERRPLPPRAGATLGQDTGVEVDALLPDGPAAAALRVEDVIVAIGERPVRDLEDLLDAMDVVPIGEPLPVTVVRGGAIVEAEVRPADLAERAPGRS